MSELAPPVSSEPTLISVERYLGLVEAGVLGPDDRVEPTSPSSRGRSTTTRRRIRGQLSS